jgi:hypothetical protein
MNKQSLHRFSAWRFAFALCIAVGALAQCRTAASDQSGSPDQQNGCGTVEPPSPATGSISADLTITGLLRAPRVSEEAPVCISGQDSPIGLNDELWVQVALTRSAGGPSPTTQEKLVAQAPWIDAGRYVLFLNGNPVEGLPSPTVRTYTLPGSHSEHRALVFKLIRGSDNKALWSDLLGSPQRFYKKVSVSVAARDGQGKMQMPNIVGQAGVSDFRLRVIHGSGS